MSSRFPRNVSPNCTSCNIVIRAIFFFTVGAKTEPGHSGLSVRFFKWTPISITSFLNRDQTFFRQILRNESSILDTRSPPEKSVTAVNQHVQPLSPGSATFERLLFQKFTQKRPVLSLGSGVVPKRFNSSFHWGNLNILFPQLRTRSEISPQYLSSNKGNFSKNIFRSV